MKRWLLVFALLICGCSTEPVRLKAAWYIHYPTVSNVQDVHAGDNAPAAAGDKDIPPEVYIALLNSSEQDVTVNDVLVNGDSVTGGRNPWRLSAYENAEWVPFQLEPGGFVTFPANHFRREEKDRNNQSRESDMLGKCRLPVSISVMVPIDQTSRSVSWSRRAASEDADVGDVPVSVDTTARMPNSLPEGWEDCKRPKLTRVADSKPGD